MRSRPSSGMMWVYLAAAAGVLILLKVVFAILTASERVASKAEKREANRGLRERLDQFTR